ncbi:hypothetical protein LINGRAHAP2_LOCUS34960 [Linum grandiflorum]
MMEIFPSIHRLLRLGSLFGLAYIRFISPFSPLAGTSLQLPISQSVSSLQTVCGKPL